jgi:ferredoxin
MPRASKNSPDFKWTVQVAPEDCTGCGMCVEACPAKDKTNPDRKAINMAPQEPLRDQEAKTSSSSSTCPILTATLSSLPRQEIQLAAAAV